MGGLLRAGARATGDKPRRDCYSPFVRQSDGTAEREGDTVKRSE